jgi:uncharacterized small protein (DUF1192 family)
LDRYPDCALDFFHLYRRWREQRQHDARWVDDPLALSSDELDRRIAQIRETFDRAIADPRNDAASAWADIAAIQEFPVGHTLETSGAPDSLVHAFDRLLAWAKSHVANAPFELTPEIEAHQRHLRASTRS